MNNKKEARLHRPIVAALVQCLDSVFQQGRTPDRVLDHTFRANKQMGSRDRRFIAEGLYDIIRWWRRLWACLDEEAKLDQASLWRIVGAWIALQTHELPEWPEFKSLEPRKIEQKAAQKFSNKAIEESVPDWLFARCEQELGEEWPEILHSLNKTANVYLRANRLKTTREKLQNSLKDEGIETQIVKDLPDGLKLEDRKNIFSSKCFQGGFFEMQDGASQLVVPQLDVAPGMRVIDACAGAGGKTLHLSSLMANKGKIIALDVSEHKLTELRRRSTRSGSDIIETKVIESSKTIKRFEATADRLLLDVPCTGLGVLRRNPDAKWKLKPEDLENINKVQSEILESYTKMLKPGGKMVYATCSILPSENRRQIEIFLNKNPQFQLLEERRLLPSSYDGFYIASLQKNK